MLKGDLGPDPGVEPLGDGGAGMTHGPARVLSGGAVVDGLSELWARVNTTQASTTSAQSATTAGTHLSIGALVFGAAGLGFGGMAYRRASKRKPE